VKVIITVPTAKPALYGLRLLPALSVILAGILLASNLPFVPGGMHAYLSAAPLALAGIGYAVLQIRKRPPRSTLLKRLLLAATFILWAVDQLLPPGRMATVIGDVVIAAYVLDLYWLIQEQTTGTNGGNKRPAV
jgi:hypothetical protein